MQKEEVTICGAFVYNLNRFCDERGSFEELFSQKLLPLFDCKQINCSRSKRNVLRGLHIGSFAKLVNCVKGKIFDVVADTRQDSPTYLQWYGLELSEENKKSLYIPKDCAYGFLALEDSVVIYVQDGLYNPDLEVIIRYDDPVLRINWPNTYIMSEKDTLARYAKS